MTMLATEPVDWSVFEAAIRDWIIEIAEITDDAIFEKQTANLPVFPYASIAYTATNKEGGRDEARNDTDETRDAGKEVRMITTAPLAVSMTISFHVDATTLNRLGPNYTGMALALRAQASLGQLSVLQHLSAANIAVVRELGVRDTSLVINGDWLGRGTLDVLFRTTAVATEYTGFIEKVGIVSEQFGIDVVLDSTEE